MDESQKREHLQLQLVGGGKLRPKGEAWSNVRDFVLDVVVTVPAKIWTAWIAEGDLPGDPWSGYESHFWVSQLPHVDIGSRVYIVALGRLRGYAPPVAMEMKCRLNPNRSCLIRRGGAVAITIPETIRGFRGFRYRWWDRATEIPFPDWKDVRFGSTAK